MPLYYSAASGSRISKKARKPPPLRRSSTFTSMFSTLHRKKPSVSRSKSLPESPIDDASSIPDEPLISTGAPVSIAPLPSITSLPHAMQFIKSHMFTPMPDRATGMNSVRIAEILNFRRYLPPVVSIAHVHAVLHPNSPTLAEKEISDCVATGVVRRIRIPHREVSGSGSTASIGEGLVLISDWRAIVNAVDDVPEALKQKYLALMATHPTAIAFPQSLLSPSDSTPLLRAGLLTLSAPSSTSTTMLSDSDPGTRSTLTSLTALASCAPSGTLAAVGGPTAHHDLGGGGLASCLHTTEPGSHFPLSLPNMGPYLRLHAACRQQLLTLLRQISPRHQEAPMSILRERWDGGSGETGLVRSATRLARGEFSGVLPGHTRKWKRFWGVGFEWVMWGAVGDASVEVFDTGSVGIGIRIVS